ncbi:unnamed protein product [Rotaria sp. Silwood2]|nr:unnamed protein product [Rotaria sp. Silwood2]CAF4090913.1 unnamed protein product [Rotaria sp. Silwood2]
MKWKLHDTRLPTLLGSSDEFEAMLNQINVKVADDNQCRYVWRQIVLQLPDHSQLAPKCADWLFNYAACHPSNKLARASSLYVALNIFLLAYGPNFVNERSEDDVWSILEDISRMVDAYGDQSKQFSRLHKMAHVWGTATVLYTLTCMSTSPYAQVCACIMRTSFEHLNIHFNSSGIESLVLLAQTHAHDFFTLMLNDPGVRIRYFSPCMSYFRNYIDKNGSISFSRAVVHEFVILLFNNDATYTNERLDHQ